MLNCYVLRLAFVCLSFAPRVSVYITTAVVCNLPLYQTPYTCLIIYTLISSVTRHAINHAINHAITLVMYENIKIKVKQEAKSATIDILSLIHI